MTTSSDGARDRLVAILLYPGLTALDAIGPYEVLHGLPGVEVRFVWKEVGPVVADSGVLVLGATHTLDEVAHPDVVLVPGSSSDTAVVMADDEVLAWLREAHAHSEFTTSVCTGALILGAAGVLDGHPATTHWAVMSGLAAFGATACPAQRVVRSGKILTAAGVSAGIDLALELTAEMFDDDTARTAQLWIEYDPRPPFDTGHISKAPTEIRARAWTIARRSAGTLRTARAVPKVLARRTREVLTEKARSRRAASPSPQVTHRSTRPESARTRRLRERRTEMLSPGTRTPPAEPE